MPPIDPAVLRARAAELAGQAAAPAACALAVRRLLESYADRSHRLSPRLAGSAPGRAYRAPAPVVRAIVNALSRPVKESPAAGFELIRAIWAGGSSEERHIASELLGLSAPAAPAEALALIESFAAALGPDSAEALAEHGLRPLLLADPAAHLPRIRQWTQHSDKYVQRLGLAALNVLAADEQWDDVPAALELLRGLMAAPDPAIRTNVLAALRALYPKSPGEVGSFLSEQAARSNHTTHLILRALLRHLPEETQAELVRQMRA